MIDLRAAEETLKQYSRLESTVNRTAVQQRNFLVVSRTRDFLVNQLRLGMSLVQDRYPLLQALQESLVDETYRLNIYR